MQDVRDGRADGRTESSKVSVEHTRGGVEALEVKASRDLPSISAANCSTSLNTLEVQQT